MKTYTVMLDEQRLGKLASLLIAAGSRLGDGAIMVQASEMVGWLQREVDAQAAPAPPEVGQKVVVVQAAA